MPIELGFEDVSDHRGVPSRADFEKWLEPLMADGKDHSIAVRVVGESEMQSLNSQYRGKDKPTNVLAFPADLPPSVAAEIDVPPLGDIVICAPVVASEAASQGKPVLHHWAHLSIHGALHLLGFDHQDEAQASEMESLEVRYLSSLGIPDPYRA